MYKIIQLKFFYTRPTWEIWAAKLTTISQQQRQQHGQSQSIVHEVRAPRYLRLKARHKPVFNKCSAVFLQLYCTHSLLTFVTYMRHCGSSRQHVNNTLFITQGYVFLGSHFSLHDDVDNQPISSQSGVGSAQLLKSKSQQLHTLSAAAYCSI